MKILISIDDTDSLEVSSTGELAGMIAAWIEDRGWGKCSPITRHQLLLHPDIPYTSHNSSMCFEADLDEKYLASLIAQAEAILTNEAAAGSDPGLCVAVVEDLADPGLLIDFGYRAKRQVLAKEDAYAVAQKAKVHLSEHGGTGQGVIGALAGVGLRLTGNDGRFQGKMRLATGEDGTASVGEILSQQQVDLVRSLADGRVLADKERIFIGNEWAKLVLLDNKATLLVKGVEGGNAGRQHCWQVCTKEDLKDY